MVCFHYQRKIPRSKEKKFTYQNYLAQVLLCSADRFRTLNILLVKRQTSTLQGSLGMTMKPTRAKGEGRELRSGNCRNLDPDGILQVGEKPQRQMMLESLLRRTSDVKDFVAVEDFLLWEM